MKNRAFHCRKDFESIPVVLTKSAPPNLYNEQYLFQISKRVMQRFRGCFVYCEFYLDVFFVVNLILDFLVLCLTNQMLRGTANPGRAFWGGRHWSSGHVWNSGYVKRSDGFSNPVLSDSGSYHGMDWL